MQRAIDLFGNRQCITKAKYCYMSVLFSECALKRQGSNIFGNNIKSICFGIISNRYCYQNYCFLFTAYRREDCGKPLLGRDKYLFTKSNRICLICLGWSAYWNILSKTRLKTLMQIRVDNSQANYFFWFI